jgi:hypothetical protein
VISVANIFDQIDDNYSIIQFEAKKNSSIWPDDDKWYFDDYTIEKELELLKDYTTYKINALDKYFLEL